MNPAHDKTIAPPGDNRPPSPLLENECGQKVSPGAANTETAGDSLFEAGNLVEKASYAMEIDYASCSIVVSCCNDALRLCPI